jgi:hypothetical protein
MFIFVGVPAAIVTFFFSLSKQRKLSKLSNMNTTPPDIPEPIKTAPQQVADQASLEFMFKVHQAGEAMMEEGKHAFWKAAKQVRQKLQGEWAELNAVPPENFLDASAEYIQRKGALQLGKAEIVGKFGVPEEKVTMEEANSIARIYQERFGFEARAENWIHLPDQSTILVINIAKNSLDWWHHYK